MGDWFPPQLDQGSSVMKEDLSFPSLGSAILLVSCSGRF